MVAVLDLSFNEYWDDTEEHELPKLVESLSEKIWECCGEMLLWLRGAARAASAVRLSIFIRLRVRTMSRSGVATCGRDGWV